MVFRFWGDRHADVQQFQPLVDRRAGGIADTVLVEAIRARGWTADHINGSIETLTRELQSGRPLILLIEDHRSRYHYIVAVGVDDDAVYFHDPTWGPDRRMALREFRRRWEATAFWALLV